MATLTEVNDPELLKQLGGDEKPSAKQGKEAKAQLVEVSDPEVLKALGGNDQEEAKPKRTPPTQQKSALRDFAENYLPLPVAADLVKSVGSQTLSSIGSGLRGIGGLITGESPEQASEAVQRIQREGSGIIPRAREPETKGGQFITKAVNAIPQLVGGGVCSPI